MLDFSEVCKTSIRVAHKRWCSINIETHIANTNISICPCLFNLQIALQRVHYLIVSCMHNRNKLNSPDLKAVELVLIP